MTKTMKLEKLANLTSVRFDMDGTIYDLYGQENWLHALQHRDPSIFKTGDAMVDIALLNEAIGRLVALGIEVSVVTWLPMHSTNSFDNACATVKKEWLETTFPHLAENLRTVSYGTPKHIVHQDVETSLIFDDNADVREEWLRCGGLAYDEKHILEIMALIEMVKGGRR